MKVFNTSYKNNKQLFQFISKNKINECSQVSIVIFSGNLDENYTNMIKTELKKSISKIIDIHITHNKCVKDIFISFSLIDTCSKLELDNRALQDRVKFKNIELHYALHHDKLTNLKNKNALIEDLKKSNFSYLLIVDIDSFQTYNDLYGFSGGNKIIKSFSKLLINNFDQDSYDIYRFHNDQFVFRSKKNQTQSSNFDHEIKNIFQTIKLFKIDTDYIDDKIEVDITAGIAIQKEFAIERATMALNYAKKYKKQYQIYNKIIDSVEKSKDTNFWNKEIKKAITDDKIIPVYQPIVNSAGETIKHEALMRLLTYNEGKEKLISPYLFLDIAIKTKQYFDLTQIMIEKSFSDMSLHGGDFSINLSYEDIINSITIKMLKEQIIKHKVGKALIIEIVENENIDNYDSVKRFINEFKELGVRIAIDDFGAGFSNYLHVLELNPNYLKIDGSLIKNINNSKKSYQLVKSITSLSKSLNIITIAEYVHSKEVFEICKELEIDEFQGFYFSQPVKIEEIEKELYQTQVKTYA